MSISHEESPREEQSHIIDFSSHLAGAAPVIQPEVRQMVNPIPLPDGRKIGIYRTLVDSGEEIDIPFSERPLIDHDPRDGSVSIASDGGVTARLEFMAPVQGSGERRTSKRLDFEAVSEDIVARKIGRASCIDIIPGEFNSKVSFEANARDPELYSKEPLTSPEDQLGLISRYESFRQRTIVVDDRGADPLDDAIHNRKAFYFPEEEKTVTLAALTAKTDYSDFRVSQITKSIDPTLAEIAVGDRKMLGILQFMPKGEGMKFWGANRLGLSESDRSEFVIISTMHPELGPVKNEQPDPLRDQIGKAIGGLINNAGEMLQAQAQAMRAAAEERDMNDTAPTRRVEDHTDDDEDDDTHEMAPIRPSAPAERDPEDEEATQEVDWLRIAEEDLNTDAYYSKHFSLLRVPSEQPEPAQPTGRMSSILNRLQRKNK